jgi:CHAT domain-containing protein/tetratricopeptide (TPR) repeat protein
VVSGRRDQGFALIDRDDFRIWLRWGLAAAGVALVGLLSWMALERIQVVHGLPEAGRATVEPAVARPFLGRLSGDAGPSPVRAPRPAALPPQPEVRGRPAGTVDAARVHAPELHELALRDLFRGDLSTGISRLEDSTLRRPEDAAAWNDLAVARLERAGREDRPADLVRALAAIDRTLAVSPELPQARFNQALILGRLHVRGQAREAWQRHLQADPSSPWADEARDGLRALGSQSLAKLWEAELPALREAIARGDANAVREVVRRMPHRARVSVEEEALGLLGAAVEDGDAEEAVRQLAFSRALGKALAETTGDVMVRESVALIDRAAEQGPPGLLDRLARGHAAFSRGLALYRDQEGEAALPWLEESARLLAEAESPFAGWARFYRTVCTHHTEVAETFAAFQRLEATTDPARYPVLAGSDAWMVGTVASYLNRPEEALAELTVARDRLASAGAPPESHGFVHVLLAETYDLLGEPDEAWRERVAGLAAAAQGGDRRRLHSTLHEAAGAAARIDPGAALPFVRELIESDRAWGNQGALVEAYSLAGRTFAAVHRYQDALDAFASAREHASGVGRGAQSEQIEMEVALAEGEALVDVDPHAAVSRLTAALDSARGRSFLGFDDRMLRARARAWQALGDVDAAEEDLLKALAVYEGVRQDLRDERLRLSYFEGAQDAFDAMIRLQAQVRRSPSSAFAFAERARARLLLDMVEDAPGSVELPRPMSAAEIAGRLPPEVVLVEYAVLPDRLLVWTFHQGVLEMTSLPRGAGELGREVVALRSALARRADETGVRAAAATLFESLLGPVLAGLPEGAPLVVVPDRFLGQVPFPALFDRRRGSYVIETRPVAVAPSATLFVTARARMRTFEGDLTVLAVGDPAFDRAAHPALPRLPGAAEEAAEVAALYPGSDLLRYGDATPEAVVAAAAVHRIVHLSGHALLDPATPWNHRLVVAPGSQDGSLDARTIAGLHLPETELVVLSACRTLPGGTERESFNGLAAAFFAAGPPVVVSSLWEVDDRATQALMVRFHRALRNGAAPAAALREAQLHLLRQEDPTLSSPAAWGGFEAFGGAITN